MGLVFNLPEFENQLMRALNYVFAEGADIGEVIATCRRIEEGNCDSWWQEWNTLGTHVFNKASEALAKGDTATARQFFLKASNYFRTAYFFLLSTPENEELVATYERHATSFSKALSLSSIDCEPVLIPSKELSLPGVFYRSPVKEKAPCLVILDGYDSTHQESYLLLVKGTLERGFHALAFDGPGQGELLIKQKIPMNHNWDQTVSAAIDFLQTKKEVESDCIALAGLSWGSMLAALAAAHEPRLKALILLPGQWDALENVEKFIPNLKELLRSDDAGMINTFFAAAMKNKMMEMRLRQKMFIHGVSTPYELIRAWEKFHLEDVAPKIQCPTFVGDTEEEPLSHGQATRLFEALQCPKTYYLFKTADGAGDHCAAGALSLMNAHLLEWLEEVISPKEVLA